MKNLQFESIPVRKRNESYNLLKNLLNTLTCASYLGTSTADFTYFTIVQLRWLRRWSWPITGITRWFSWPGTVAALVHRWTTTLARVISIRRQACKTTLCRYISFI